MHPLMNRFHADERRRLAEFLGVRDSFAPVLSRRVFLQSAGATGLVIGFGWLAPTGADAALPGAEGAATGPLAPNAFVRVGTDNLVTVICKHHEMGQGNTTGLASLLADELDADWSLVRTEYAPSDANLYKNLAFGLQGTGGSSAIANSFLQYRSAGATAKATSCCDWFTGKKATRLICCSCARWCTSAAPERRTSGCPRRKWRCRPSCACAGRPKRPRFGLRRSDRPRLTDVSLR